MNLGYTLPGVQKWLEALNGITKISRNLIVKVTLNITSAQVVEMYDFPPHSSLLDQGYVGVL